MDPIYENHISEAKQTFFYVQQAITQKMGEIKDELGLKSSLRVVQNLNKKWENQPWERVKSYLKWKDYRIIIVIQAPQITNNFKSQAISLSRV